MIKLYIYIAVSRPVWCIYLLCILIWVGVYQNEQGVELPRGRGVMRRDCPHPNFVQRKVLHFKVKNAGFCAFLLRKSTCGQKLASRGLNRPLGGWRWGVENLSGGSTPPTPINSQPDLNTIYTPWVIWGEVGSLLIILSPVSYWMCRWKNYENRSIFSKDMDKSIVSPFFDSRCIFKEGLLPR